MHIIYSTTAVNNNRSNFIGNFNHNNSESIYFSYLNLDDKTTFKTSHNWSPQAWYSNSKLLVILQIGLAHFMVTIGSQRSEFLHLFAQIKHYEIQLPWYHRAMNRLPRCCWCQAKAALAAKLDDLVGELDHLRDSVQHCSYEKQSLMTSVSSLEQQVAAYKDEEQHAKLLAEELKYEVTESYQLGVLVTNQDCCNSDQSTPL